MTAPDSTATAMTCMVVADIDGTTTRECSDTVPEQTVRAVEEVRAAGHEVVLASGRSLIGVLPIAAQLGIRSGWVIASNGAVTARLDPRVCGGYTLERVEVFDPEPAIRIALDRVPEAGLAVEEIGWGYRVRSRFPDGMVNGDQEIQPLADLWSVPVTRLIVRTPGAVEKLLGPLRETGATATPGIGPDWIDVTPTGLSKATAAEYVREQLLIPREDTVAVDDGVNGIELLRWAGRGVAMGHAPQQVRDAADEITGTITQAGLVPVLHSLLAADEGGDR